MNVDSLLTQWAIFVCDTWIWATVNVAQRPRFAPSSLRANTKQIPIGIRPVLTSSNLFIYISLEYHTFPIKEPIDRQTDTMIAAFTSSKMAPLISRRLAAAGSTYPIPSYRSGVSRAASPSVRQYSDNLAHSQALSSQPRRSVLEVERKFAPTAISIRQLDQNTGEPPFESVVHKGVTCFEDTYYDTPDDALSNAGVWIRRREKFECGVRRFTQQKPAGPRAARAASYMWESKVRVGGDFINSAFKEITDMQEISTILSNLVPGAELDAHHWPQGEQVREMAKFVTDRTGYVVNGKFTVVIDVTDFGHTVGEVELERDASEAEGKGEDKALAIAAMDKEVGDFMRRFFWAFPAGKPVGKLTAYFDRKTSRQLEEQS